MVEHKKRRDEPGETENEQKLDKKKGLVPADILNPAFIGSTLWISGLKMNQQSISEATFLIC